MLDDKQRLSFSKDDLKLSFKNLFFICEDFVNHSENKNDIYACRVLMNRIGNVIELFTDEYNRHKEKRA